MRRLRTPRFPGTAVRGKEADDKFWALRNEGYTGPIDHNGDKVEDLDQWIEDHS